MTTVAVDYNRVNSKFRSAYVAAFEENPLRDSLASLSYVLLHEFKNGNELLERSNELAAVLRQYRDN